MRAGNVFYVATPGKVAVLNAIGGTNLQQVGAFTDARISFLTGLALQESRVFLSDLDSLFIIDAANPSSPTLLAQHPLPTRVVNGRISGGAAVLAIDHDHLYLRGPEEASGHDLIVWDISNPFQPNQVSMIDGLGYQSGSARIVEDHLYLTGGGSLTVVDISLPSQPRILSKSETPPFLSGDIIIDRGHAFVSAPDLPGFNIFNIATSTNVQPVSQFRIPHYFGDVIVSRNHAYLSSYSAGTHIIDVSDPSKPHHAGFIDISGSIAVEGDFAYIAGQRDQTSQTRGLYVVDVSDPTQPRVVGSLEEDLYVSALIVSGGYAFLKTHGTFTVVDVRDPARPQKIGSFEERYGGSSFRVRNNLLYIGDAIIDISDPAHPVQVGSFNNHSFFDIAFLDTIAYATTFGALIVYDVSDPRAPVELASEIQHGGLRTSLDDNLLAAGNFIYDIRIPADPKRIGTLTLSNGVAVANGRVYAVTPNLNIYQVNLDSRTPQTIEFQTPTDLLFSNAPIRLDARTSSGLPVSYTLVSGAAVLNGDLLSISRPGSIIIRASQSGNDQFLPQTVEHIFNAIPLPKLSFAPVGAWPGHDRGPAMDIKVADDIAYVAAGMGGLIVLDVSDPTHLVPLGGTALGSGQNSLREAEKVAISEGYAYLPTSFTLEIVDVRNPREPVRLPAYNEPGYEKDIAVWRGTNLLSANSHDGIRLLSIQLPESPALIAHLAPASSNVWSAYTAHADQNFGYVSRDYDIMIVDLTSSTPQVASYYTNSMVGTVSGDLLYANRQHAHVIAPDSNNPGFTIVDVSDRQNPQELGNYYSQYRISEIVVSNSYAYLTTIRTNINVPGMPPASRLEIADVSNPQAPLRASFFEDPSILKAAVGLAIAGDYAYVVDLKTGVQVFNVGDPAQPVLVGGYETAGFARGVAISDNYAYVADNTAGLQVIELASGNRVGSYKTEGIARAAAVSGGYAYLLGTDPAEGLHVINITHPQSLVKVGSYPLPANASAIEISGDFAFVISDDKTLRIIDVSAPQNPTLAGSYSDPSNLENLAVSGSYAFLSAGDAGVRVIDFSDPANPRPVGTHNTAGQARDLVATQNHLFVADGNGGLLVLDISNPAQPVRIADYPTKGNAIRIAKDGDRVYLSDADDFTTLGYGLVAFDVQNAADPQFLGSLPMDQAAEDLAFANGYLCVAYGQNGIHLFQIDYLNPQAPPDLRIRTLGTQIELVWPLAATDFYLQRSSALHSPEGWTDISATVSQQTNQCSVRIDHPDNHTFFRLIKR